MMANPKQNEDIICIGNSTAGSLVCEGLGLKVGIGIQPMSPRVDQKVHSAS